MKSIRILGRNIRDGFRSVGRNFSLSIASISCITITLLIVALAVMLSANVENVTNIIKKDFTIVAFIDTNVTSEELSNLKQKVEQMGNIESVTIKKKKEIAEEMRGTSDSLAAIIDTWSDEENPLYDTLQIKVDNQEIMAKTAKDLEKEELVAEVRYGQGMVETLLSTFKGIERGMIIAMVALVLVTLFLISNTIKITIFSRKREIEIMRLVGASNFSIKQPFVVEGFCLGFLGAIIPVCTVLYGYSAFFKNYNGHLFSPIITLVKPEPFIYLVSLIIIGLGIVVGMIGSYRAVRKYLKI